MDHANDDVYDHQLVTEDYLPLAVGDRIMVVHFFAGPQFVRYVPRDTIHDNTDEDMAYAAYVLHEEKLWATKVFSDIEDFYNVFKLIEGAKNSGS